MEMASTSCSLEQGEALQVLLTFISFDTGDVQVLHAVEKDLGYANIAISPDNSQILIGGGRTLRLLERE